LPQASEDPETGNFEAAVSVHDVVELHDPKANVRVQPHDQIFVARAQIIYVIGNVIKPGGFPLSQKKTISALEALSLAEGPNLNASSQHARILRNSGSSATREQIPIDLKKVLAGKIPDVQLMPDDVLFVPDNTAKRAATRAAEAALTTISGLIIWRGL